jgi:hypothetical protein
MSVPQMVTGQDRVQPTLFAMQVALAASMKAYGVHRGAPGNFFTTTQPQASNENLSCWPYRLTDSAVNMSLCVQSIEYSVMSPAT